MSAPATTEGELAANKEYNGGSVTQDHANGAQPRSRGYDYGGNPLAHTNTGDSARFPAFGGEFQPGLYRPTTNRQFANPAPLGLSAFALTTFVLSLVNIGVRDVTEPNVVVAIAFGYGGLIQLLAGMWYVKYLSVLAGDTTDMTLSREMAVGNTFGATALSSYGGFWLSFAIILTPGGFDIQSSYTGAGTHTNDFNNAFGYFLIGWFIFTTILVLCTLRSTVAFFLLFFFLDLAFLFLAIARFQADSAGAANVPLNKAGGCEY